MAEKRREIDIEIVSPENNLFSKEFSSGSVCVCVSVCSSCM